MCELIFGLSSFTSGLNAVKYANCVKQTYRVNTKKKKHTCTFPLPSIQV